EILLSPLTLGDIKHNTHPAGAVTVRLINGPASRCNPSLAAVGKHHAIFPFERQTGLLLALNLSNDSGPVVRMDTANYVLECEHIVRAEAKQRTQTRVDLQSAMFQIAHPQAQLAGASRKFHELLAFPKRGLSATSPRTVQDQTNDQKRLNRNDGQRSDDVPA